MPFRTGSSPKKVGTSGFPRKEMFSLARAKAMAVTPEGDVNGVEFFMGADVKRGEEILHQKSCSAQGLGRSVA